MKSFFECNLFEDKQFEIKSKFTVSQNELLLKGFRKEEFASFSKLSVDYNCKWRVQNNFDVSKPTIIIPSKDTPKLIKKTIKNLEQKNITKHCNLILVDDRSKKSLKQICKNYSYLRVDNNKGFNFSMLNNIAAFIVKKLGGKQIILWNNDLWTASEEFFIQLLHSHNTSGSSVSGSKLLYPPKEISFIKEEDSLNIKEFYANMSGKWRETVQYAGPVWLPVMPKYHTLTPLHYRRFSSKDDPRVNCNKGVSCLTGALMVIELEHFIKLGGLNPSLSKNLQDTDFCLKTIENGLRCFYFGKDIFFYHDESVSLSGKKKDNNQLLSDEVLFGKIWNDKVAELVL